MKETYDLVLPQVKQILHCFAPWNKVSKDFEDSIFYKYFLYVVRVSGILETARDGIGAMYLRKKLHVDGLVIKPFKNMIFFILDFF